MRLKSFFCGLAYLLPVPFYVALTASVLAQESIRNAEKTDTGVSSRFINFAACTSSSELSADEPHTARLVTQPFQTVA